MQIKKIKIKNKEEDQTADRNSEDNSEDKVHFLIFYY